VRRELSSSARSAHTWRAYGLDAGLALAEPDAKGLSTAEADADGEALPEALGSTEMLGTGVGVAGGKSAVGTFRKASTKMRMKTTSTISTHGRASVSFWGGSAPR
jgi:hypothetical protein